MMYESLPYKQCIHALAALLLTLIAQGVDARTCTSTDSGAWDASATWSCGSAPAAGDTIIIQAGHTVTVNANHTYTGTPIRVKVYGTLFFNGGGAKLSFPCGSIVEVMTPLALITGNNTGSSQTIKICGTTFWAVSHGPVNGPVVWPIGATLPVELIFFTVAAEGSVVVCNWATATERNSDRFEVYRSMDNVTKELVITQPAAGNSTTRIDYRAVDPMVPPGLWYFSLRQIDVDGSAEELGTQVMHIRTSGPVVWPNPVSEGPVVVRIGEAAIPSLRLVDIVGREFAPRIRALSSELVEIDTSDLPSGIYELRVNGSAGLGGRFQKL